MTLFEIIFMVIALLCCTSGSIWLIWDMCKQLKMYDEFIKNKDKQSYKSTHDGYIKIYNNQESVVNATINQFYFYTA